MKLLTHIIRQPFIVATGFAALIHSTWSLGTMFSGLQPNGESLVHIAGWLIPAALIAFALDIGQIVTSAEIRAHGLTWRRTVTFVVFACATFYLQFLYIVHHMPPLELAPGIRSEWAGILLLMRDAAVFILPSLLPASTLLYTLSGQEAHQEAAPATAELAITKQYEPITVLPDRPDEPYQLNPVPVRAVIEQHEAYCEACGWKQTYTAARSAKAAEAGHRAHCPVLHGSEK